MMTLRRSLAVAALVVSASAATAGAPAADDPPGEYQVKALFLMNFAKFVEWPSTAFQDPGDAIVIVVVGDDPFGPLLDQAAAADRIGGRPVVVRRASARDRLPRCHMLFVSASERRRVQSVLANAKEAPVLTVADFDDFAELGGMIGFRKENYRIRFDVNLPAATAANLKLSAKMLTLARVVTSRPPQASQ